MRIGRSRQALLAAVWVCTLSLPLSAAEFRAFGPRAVSMGGAGVANPDGAFSVYYNPAALATFVEWEDLAPVCLGGRIRDGGLADPLNALIEMDVKWADVTQDPTGEAAQRLIDIVRNIEDGDAILVMPYLASLYRLGSLGFGVYGSAQIAAYGQVDREHLGVAPPTDPGSFFYNTSELVARGLGLVEVPIAYAWQFDLEPGKLSVGGAVKFIRGFTFDAREALTADSEQVRRDLQDADKSSSGFGIDAGILFQPERNGLSLGLLARNINSPEFKTARGDSFSEDMQVRAGVAYALDEQWTAALDLDLTSNETLVPGEKSRQLGGGISFSPSSWCSLRAGLMTDLEARNSSVAWCFGGSIGPKSFRLDVGAAVSGARKTVDDYSFPADASVTVALQAGW